MFSLRSHNPMASAAAMLLSFVFLFTAEAAHHRSIRGIRGGGSDLEGVTIRNSNNNEHQQRKLQGILGSENWKFLDKKAPFVKQKKINKFGILARKKSSKSTSSDTASPTRSPVVSEPTQPSFISGLIDSSNENNSGSTEDTSGSINDNTIDSVCLGVASQNPPSETIEDSSTREYSMTVDVVYQPSTTVSSTDIESYLNGQNLAMALWIAGCDEMAEGKRRKLQEEISTPTIITYSQVGSWDATGACVESDIQIGLLEPSAPLCQQGFSSNIQLQASENASSEDLTNQIARAFGATSKPALESQQGVSGVTIREISRDSDSVSQVLESETNQSAAQDNRRRRTIIFGSIGGFCLLVIFSILLLTCLYKKRRKAYVFLGKNAVPHVPFKDEIENDRENDNESISFTNTEDSDVDLILVKSNEIEETNSTFEKSNNGQGNGGTPNITASPCYNATDIPVPFDERRECSSATCQECESTRREGNGRRPIQSPSPKKSIPIKIGVHNSLVTPDFEKRRLLLDADASRRNYVHDDSLVL